MISLCLLLPTSRQGYCYTSTSEGTDGQQHAWSITDTCGARGEEVLLCTCCVLGEIAMARLFRFTRSTMSTMCRGVLCMGPLSSCWSTGVLTVRARGELYQCLHSCTPT